MRQHLTFANVCSFLALFVAVSTGGAYAASKLIDGKRIKPGSVKARQLASSAVTSAKVRDGSLVPKDFKAGTLTSGPAGPAGPQGPKGEPGPAGPAGPAGTATIGPDSVTPEHLAATPVFVARGDTVAISAGSSTAVPFDLAFVKRGITHSTTTNRENVVVERAGTYLVTATVEFTGGSITGTNAEMRRAWIRSCADDNLRYGDATTRTVTGQGFDAVNVTAIVPLQAGDCIRLMVRSGQNVTVTSNGYRATGLQMAYIGR